MLLAHSQPLIKGAPLYPQVANRRPARDRYLAASEKLGHFQEDIMNLIIATEPDIISTVNKPSTRSSQTVKNPSNNDESQIISVAKVRVYPLEDSNGIYQVIVKEFDLNTTNFSWRNTIREQNGISTIDDLLCQGELSNRQGYFSEEAINCVASTWHGPDLVFICNLQYFLDSWVLIAMRQTKTIPGANAAPLQKAFHYLLLPLHHQSHWTLVIMNKISRTIGIMDSYLSIDSTRIVINPLLLASEKSLGLAAKWKFVNILCQRPKN